MHAANETSERGGFSMYVPEDDDPAHAYPLVTALHGGAGHGRLFLWSWLREARGRGVILGAHGNGRHVVADHGSPQVDSDNLVRVLEEIAQRWNIDRSHLLLTGMSDGGTFTLLSGVDDGSPFTHLAPVAASFHPLLLTMTDPRRVKRLFMSVTIASSLSRGANAVVFRPPHRLQLKAAPIKEAASLLSIGLFWFPYSCLHSIAPCYCCLGPSARTAPATPAPAKAAAKKKPARKRGRPGRRPLPPKTVPAASA